MKTVYQIRAEIVRVTRVYANRPALRRVMLAALAADLARVSR